MRRRGWRCRWGCAVAAVGIIILLALVLPGAFWWFLLAIALIAAGLWIMRCC